MPAEPSGPRNRGRRRGLGRRAGRGVRRDLLRQAVESNVRTMEGKRARKHGIRRPTSRALWLAATAIVLALAAYVVPKALGLDAHDLGFWAIATRAPAATPSPGAPTLVSATPIDSAVFPVSVRRIVLDPGHGGRDGGSSAGDELVEKELALDIAIRLRDLLLEGGDFEVFLTREDDEFVDLRERSRRANELAADLFLSIHLNWLEPKTQRGVETFFLGPTEDPQLVALTRRENLESGYSLADVRTLLDGIYLDLRHEQSQRLATAVQSSLFQAVRSEGEDVRDRGAKAAPFLVLVTTEMPAVLVEVSALSHPAEVDLLKDEDYRQRIAASLRDGVVRYAEQLARS